MRSVCGRTKTGRSMVTFGWICQWMLWRWRPPTIASIKLDHVLFVLSSVSKRENPNSLPSLRYVSFADTHFAEVHPQMKSKFLFHINIPANSHRGQLPIRQMLLSWKYNVNQQDTNIHIDTVKKENFVYIIDVGKTRLTYRTYEVMQVSSTWVLNANLHL